MKYVKEIWGAFAFSSILLFSLSIIVYLFYPVKYIGNIDDTILVEITLLIVFISIIIEIVGDFFEKQNDSI